MRAVLERLLEVQELELVMAESAILHGSKHSVRAGRLQRKVEALRRDVDPVVLRRFDQLRTRGTMAVSREIDGVCNACRLNVPKGDINRMLRGAMEWVCPNCGRFLFLLALP